MEPYTTIDEYIAQFPEERRQVLEKIRDVIRAASPESEETIRYGIPTFRLNGSNLVHFAAFKNHFSFFPTSSGIGKFEEELAPYKLSKGTMQFPAGKPVPYDLIAEIDRFRVKETLSMPAKKKPAGQKS